MPQPKYVTQLEKVPQLSAQEREQLSDVVARFPFRSNEYYQSLIDWNDPHDPIRRLIVPHTDELTAWGSADPSNEAAYTVLPGLEHKYPDTALLLLTDVCGAFCRFCFRKRIFEQDNDEVARDIDADLAYLKKRPEISNLLVTGGDPLMASSKKIATLLDQLAEIDHLRIIRLGSKLFAFNPHRIINDPKLLETFKRFAATNKQLYLMIHFNHPRELTTEAHKAVELVQDTGVSVAMQTPLIRGINDDPAVLGKLFNECSYLGLPPYYLFQCRPTSGNRSYTVPLEEGYQIFLDAQRNSSGLARRARFVMSHASGKVEVVGLTDNKIIFRYHRAADPANEGQTIIRPRDPNACWFDDYFPNDEQRVA